MGVRRGAPARPLASRKRLSCTAFAAVALAAALTPFAVARPRAVHDAAAPVMVAATLADRDRDGRVDEVLVRFSEPISFDGARSGGGPFAVTGRRIVRVPRAARRTTVRLIL